MTDIEIKDLATELFYIYTIVTSGKMNKNNLSERTNLVLSFEKYACHIELEVLQRYCPALKQSDIKHFHQIVHQMTSRYLNDNIKTLAIY